MTPQLDLARSIRSLSVAEWGDRSPTMLIGQHDRLQEALERTVRFARSESAVLLSGETGTGKELFARAIYLLAPHHRRTFLRVNCAQYVGEQLVASELFGHRRGSFTGAVSDHRGVFEEADGGTVFLDEIGDLPHAAQAMLLRVLGEGEIVPVGATHAKQVNVRVIAASSRDLASMAETGAFRADLYYRLRQLRVHVPALRERGDDWQLIAEHYLATLASRTDTTKRLSTDTMNTLRSYPWPGNVREVRSCMETAFHLSDGTEIGLGDFGEALEADARSAQFRRVPLLSHDHLCARMIEGQESFWQVVYEPFMERELNRAQVQAVVDAGLGRARGSYKRLLPLFGVGEAEYLKFMDFLRHHDLKPAR